MIGRLALVALAVVACGCSAGESGEVERWRGYQFENSNLSTEVTL